jgi:hypothetical protein
MQKTEMKKIWDLVEKYTDNNIACLTERWEKFPINIYENEISEVIFGLLSRQITISNQLAVAPQLWNPHSAPLFLRSMGDCYINLAWICENPRQRSKEFVLYGIGQEILLIEHYKAIANASEEPEIERMIKLKESWVDSQRQRQLTEVNLGSWSGQSVRKMAEEAGEMDFYKFSYAPFSAVVHSSWQHVSIFNLTHCQNPLHKFHQIPAVLDFHPEPDYVYRSAKYVSKALRLIDSKFGINSELEQPVDYINDLLSEAFPGEDNENAEDEDVVK